jgi:hypothetical protein
MIIAEAFVPAVMLSEAKHLWLLACGRRNCRKMISDSSLSLRMTKQESVVVTL